MKIYTTFKAKKNPKTQISKGYRFILWVTMSHFLNSREQTRNSKHYDHLNIDIDICSVLFSENNGFILVKLHATFAGRQSGFKAEFVSKGTTEWTVCLN